MRICKLRTKRRSFISGSLTRKVVDIYIYCCLCFQDVLLCLLVIDHWFNNRNKKKLTVTNNANWEKEIRNIRDQSDIQGRQIRLFVLAETPTWNVVCLIYFILHLLLACDIIMYVHMCCICPSRKVWSKRIWEKEETHVALVSLNSDMFYKCEHNISFYITSIWVLEMITPYSLISQGGPITM